VKGGENNLNGDILVSGYSCMNSECSQFTREGILSIIIAYRKLREFDRCHVYLSAVHALCCITPDFY
jgi:hypothetical protein